MVNMHMENKISSVKSVIRKDIMKGWETYSRGINSFIIILFAKLVLVRNDFFRDCAFFIKSLLYPFLKYSLEMSYIAKIKISEFFRNLNYFILLV